MWFVIGLEYNSNKSHNGFTKLKALTTQRLANLTKIKFNFEDNLRNA